MKVAFSTGVVSTPSTFRHLTALFWMFIDGRHTWCVEDPDPIRNSLWFEDSAASVKEAVRDLLPKVARKVDDEPDLLVVSHGNATGYDDRARLWRATPDAAAWYLGRPLLLIVENALCDGAFIRLVLTRVCAQKIKRKLGEATFDVVCRGWKSSPLGDGRWVEVRHGGGSTTAIQIELATQQTPNLPPRLFVMVDSDRETPGTALKTNSTAKAVCDIADELNQKIPAAWKIEPFVLTKREVENYLPKEALRARYGQRASFTDWLQMTDEQQDHLDIKEHFEGKPWRILIEPDQQRHLHSNALRERAGNGGRELDQLASAIASKL